MRHSDLVEGRQLAQGILAPGEQIGSLTVPPDRIGFCSVCSITINGVLLKHGVPTTSRFGGLLELRDRTPVRFVEMIHYDGTSIDPLEVFIRSGMTDYHGAILRAFIALLPFRLIRSTATRFGIGHWLGLPASHTET